MINDPEYVNLFERLYPAFFEQHCVRGMSPSETCDEMVLHLADFDRDAPAVPCDPAAAFGQYHGERDRIVQAVAKVSRGWAEKYRVAPADEIYCATVGDEIASFCLIKHFGEATFRGKTVRVGGPGCVGTVPEFRRRGIGLKMIQRATAILQDGNYDISYIHWTAVAGWYARLGYESVVRWNRDGITTI